MAGARTRDRIIGDPQSPAVAEGDALRAVVLHEKPIVIDLIELTLNHGRSLRRIKRVIPACSAPIWHLEAQVARLRAEYHLLLDERRDGPSRGSARSTRVLDLVGGLDQAVVLLAVADREPQAVVQGMA